MIKRQILERNADGRISAIVNVPLSEIDEYAVVTWHRVRPRLLGATSPATITLDPRDYPPDVRAHWSEFVQHVSDEVIRDTDFWKKTTVTAVTLVWLQYSSVIEWLSEVEKTADRIAAHPPKRITGEERALLGRCGKRLRGLLR